MNKNYAQPSAHLSRYTFPLDRLGYFESYKNEGELLTKLINIQAFDDLSINVSTSAAGYVYVALLDSDNKFIPGFDFSACRELIGNEFSKPVRWFTSSTNCLTLGDCGFSSVKIFFRILEAKLFSFSLSPTITNA
jgi:hypothetical protein